MHRVAFGVGLVLALAACKTPDGVNAVAFGTVTGRVVDTQSLLPIAGASITLGNLVQITAPSDNGAFILRNVPVGTQNLRIDARGWQRYTVAVTVTKDQTTDVGVIGLPSALTGQ
jgi:hypothetical protein